METHLQETAGLRRTAPIQSPVPVSARLSPLQRMVVGAFLVVLVLAYLAYLLPSPAKAQADVPAPVVPTG